MFIQTTHVMGLLVKLSGILKWWGYLRSSHFCVWKTIVGVMSVIWLKIIYVVC